MKLSSNAWNMVGWSFVVLACWLMFFGSTWGLVLSGVVILFAIIAVYMGGVEDKKEELDEKKKRDKEIAKRVTDFMVFTYNKLTKMGYVPLGNTIVSLVGVLTPSTIFVSYGDNMTAVYKYDEFKEELLSEGFALVSDELIAVFLEGEKETQMVFAKK